MIFQNILRKGISKKGSWIVILAFVNILVMFGGGIILREFPRKHDGGSHKVILRYDDYELYQGNLKSTSLEEEFIKFVLTNSIKMSIAPVPFAVSNEEMQNNDVLPSKIQLLTEGLRKNLFEICLHGYQHKNNSVKWSPSEFSGVSLQTQKTWINKGKRKLEDLTGAKVKAFVPPFNGWDKNTLMALTDNGFSILSAEAGDFPKINPINYFPYTVTPKELEYLLANNYIGDNKLIVVNIHPHDLLEDKNRIGFSNLKKLLEELKDPNSKMELESFEDMVAKRIVFTQEELLNLSKRFDEVRFWDNLPLSGWLIRTTCLAANRPYYSSLVLNFLKILMGVNLFIIGFLISQVVGQKIRSRMFICAIIMTLLGMVMFIILLRSFEYLNYGQIIAGKRYSIIFLIFGILSGLILKMLPIRQVK
jgi:peptidoglycan/xylan/chitin deacetylase (PgdA/CDA1 family)